MGYEYKYIQQNKQISEYSLCRLFQKNKLIYFQCTKQLRKHLTDGRCHLADMQNRCTDVFRQMNGTDALNETTADGSWKVKVLDLTN